MLWQRLYIGYHILLPSPTLVWKSGDTELVQPPGFRNATYRGFHLCILQYHRQRPKKDRLSSVFTANVLITVVQASRRAPCRSKLVLPRDPATVWRDSPKHNGTSQCFENSGSCWYQQQEGVWQYLHQEHIAVKFLVTSSTTVYLSYPISART